MLPALISAGAGLLGGFMQNRSNKKSASKQFKNDRAAMLLQDQLNQDAERRQFHWNQRTEKDRFQWLVQGAESAGFNPLTVLGATGGAMGNAPNSMAPSAAVQQAPLSNIGQTLAQAGENFARFYVDPIQKQTQVLSNQLLQKQIAQIDRENLRFGAGGLKRADQPVRTSGALSPLYTGMGDRVSDSRVAEEALSQREQEEGNKNMYSWWQPRPDAPTGAVFEDWYGDGPVSWAYSMGKFPLDVMHNVRKKTYETFGTPEPWEWTQQRSGAKGKQPHNKRVRPN